MNRSGLYYTAKNEPENDVTIMNEIQDIYTEYSFLGYRKIREMLKNKMIFVNRKKVQRLMQVMNLQAIYPQKRHNAANKAHRKYPYLLKKLEVIRPNQVWQTDLTYIKIRGGFVYLICLIDVFSRKIMGWSISIFLDTTSCIAALEAALTSARPEILNSDQGSQFTSDAWCDMVLQKDIQISMDGKGRWADNIYIERLWRSIKYEMVYLHSFETVDELRCAVDKYVHFYNHRRPHQALNYRTPNAFYNDNLRNFNDQSNRGAAHHAFSGIEQFSNFC